MRAGRDGAVPEPLDQPGFRAQFAALRTWAWLDTPGSPPGAAPVLHALRETLQSWEEGEFSWRDWEIGRAHV